ncbi:hypothetical protein C4D60_Mb04t23820 [Musa balbisiana]|uniref:Uncharacterized protein n=1 Tax=Musa balbisiana TaxID=52838 RepID=A0A4S8KEG5_MUSBA|nr:hypothetical protein C4D60_Mb04t23820 [Musa balbisiana]
MYVSSFVAHFRLLRRCHQGVVTCKFRSLLYAKQKVRGSSGRGIGAPHQRERERRLQKLPSLKEHCTKSHLLSLISYKVHKESEQTKRSASGTRTGKDPPERTHPTVSKTRYPVVVRFNKVNHAAVSTKNYALDEILENSLWIGELKDCALQACQSKMDDNP